jgi:hypothetical protein
MLIQAVIPSVHIIIIKFSKLAGFKIDVCTYIPTKPLLTYHITISKLKKNLNFVLQLKDLHVLGNWSLPYKRVLQFL